MFPQAKKELSLLIHIKVVMAYLICTNLLQSVSLKMYPEVITYQLKEMLPILKALKSKLVEWQNIINIF